MRPCNQCRQPVENSVTICEQCKKWNASHSQDQSEAPGDTSHESANRKSDIYADYSYALMMGVFSLVITALFALIGMAIYGFDGFVIGGSIGLVLGLVLFSIMIKM